MKNIKKIILDILELTAPATSQEIIFFVKEKGIKYTNKTDLMDKITDSLNDLIREKKVFFNVYDEEITFE